MPQTEPKGLRILALGDSLTAGYLVPAKADYPSRVQGMLNRDGLDARIENHGVCGDNCPCAMARLDRILSRPWDLAVVGLGVNDILQGRTPDRIRSDLREIILRLQTAGARVLLLGMRLPGVWAAFLSHDPPESFQALYADLARETGVALHPDFLGPALDRGLLLDDGLHPDAQGLAAMAESLYPAILPFFANPVRSV